MAGEKTGQAYLSQSESLFKKIKQTAFFEAMNTLQFCHIYEVSIYLYAFYYSLNTASLKKNHFTEHKAETP